MFIVVTGTCDRDLARQHTPAALAALRDIMSDKKAPPSTRVVASDALLNRAWGWSTQMIVGDEEAGPVQLVVSWTKS